MCRVRDCEAWRNTWSKQKAKKVPKKERIKEEERARRKRRENREGVEWWACEPDSTCLGCARTIYTGMAAEASWTFSSLSLARRSLLPPTLCIFLPPFLLFCLISLSFSFCQSFFVFVHASPTSWLSRHFVSFFLSSIQLVLTLFLSRSLLNAREDRAPRIPRLLVYAFAYVCIRAVCQPSRGNRVEACHSRKSVNASEPLTLTHVSVVK